jgi:hypothetical protein
MSAPHPSDLGVTLGHAIWAFVEPHVGHEVAFNRWYERDHFLAAGSMTPWTLSTQRWVARPALRALRYPEQNPIAEPVTRGIYLGAIWIQQERIEEQQGWVSDQLEVFAKNDRNFQYRDVVTTAPYDVAGVVRRDPDGVPPELALDRRYPGVVLTWTERTEDSSLEALVGALMEEVLPRRHAGSPMAMTLAFTPRPKPSSWPAAVPEVPGVGDRVLLASFLEESPASVWEHFEDLGKCIDATGVGRTLLVAPFEPVVPGEDIPADELR